MLLVQAGLFTSVYDEWHNDNNYKAALNVVHREGYMYHMTYNNWQLSV